MPTDYPFKPCDAVATKFLDAKHMDVLGAPDARSRPRSWPPIRRCRKVLEYARSHPQWPNPASVAVVDGMGVVVFSKPRRREVDSQ